MNNKINKYEDLKLIFLPSRYVTQDESCGYDEIVFLVRKSWLQEWFNNNIKCEDMNDMDEWLKDFYSENEANDVYFDASIQNEIIIEKKLWNNRIHYYEVYEQINEGLETNTTILKRTIDLESAIQVYRNVKTKTQNDEEYKENYLQIANLEDFCNGEAEIKFQKRDEPTTTYSLYLTENEIEQ